MMSNILYKFFPIKLSNKKEENECWKHIKDALSGKLYFSDFPGLNDPHETLSVIDRGYLNHILAPGSEATLGDDTILKADKALSERFGVTCFMQGEAYKYQQNWAHYTDQSLGVCIEYEINESFLYSKNVPGDKNNSDECRIKTVIAENQQYNIEFAYGDVIYKDKPLTFDSDTMAQFFNQANIIEQKSGQREGWVQKAVKNFHLTSRFVKCSQWSNEMEYRIVARIDHDTPEDTDWRLISISDIKDSKYGRQNIIKPMKVIISLATSFNTRVTKKIQSLAEEYNISVSFIHTGTRDYEYFLENFSMLESYPD
jgi:hypothetical protein